MSAPVQSMTHRTLSGLFWSFLAAGANVIALLLVLIVLARLLTPADFGVVAAALTVIGFSAIFSQLGIGPAVVQRPELTTAHLRSAFTLSCGLGLLLGALTWVTAPLVADVFRLEELTQVLRVLSWVFPIQGLAVVAESLLMRELRFRCIAVLEIIAVTLGYGAVGIVMALIGCGVWSLVGAHLAQTVLRSALVMLVRPHPALPLLERRACADLLHFGGGFTAGRISNYLAGQGEHVVIGYCLGAVALGVYGRAYQLMAGPAVLFGNVLDRVLFPAMVQVQDQPKRLAYAFRRGNSLIALVILPLSAAMVVLAPEIVEVLLGAEWTAVTLPLQILAVGMLFRTGCKISDSLVRATGKVYQRSWRQAVYAISVIVAAILGQPWGVDGVAVGVLITLFLNFLLMAELALAISQMSWRNFAAAHGAGLGLATLVGVIVYAAALGLRSLAVPPLAVLVLSMTALVPFAILAVRFPLVFVGQDGEWMIRRLNGFLRSAVTATSESTGPAPVATDMAAAIGNVNGSATPTPAHPLARLNDSLAAAGVRYCRWKPHSDSARVLSGEGDLDLLVHDAHMVAFLQAAQHAGFKRVSNCLEPVPPHEVHLYGMQPDTGVMPHVHAQSTLFAGNSALGRSLQILDAVVLRHASCGMDTDCFAGMPATSPASALIVFVLQAMEQYGKLIRLARVHARRAALEAKLHRLLAMTGAGDWPAVLERELQAIPRENFADCLAALSQPTTMLKRHVAARRLLRAIRGVQSSEVGFPLRRILGSLRTLVTRLVNGRGSPKQFPDGGRVIAIVGPDASGKSTMVSAATRWLGQVFRVQNAHLGKPPSAWLTWPANVAMRVMRVVTPQLRTTREDTMRDGEAKTRGRGLMYSLRAVMLAWDRRALAQRLARQATRGWMIVCDRYPSPVVGSPDGARLAQPEAGARGLRAWLARLEQRLYRDVPAPDIVVRLSAPLNVAIDRNRDRVKAGKESTEFVTRRHGSFFLPAFPGAQLVELDTNQTQAATVQTLYQRVWEHLGQPRRRAVAPVISDGASQDSMPPRPAVLRAGGSQVVEFIGVTGVGKSTLMAAVSQAMNAQGYRVMSAEEFILARCGLTFIRNAKLQSAVVHALALLPLVPYLCTRDGMTLVCLGLAAIVRGRNGTWGALGLFRNFFKRIGCHQLLEQARRRGNGAELILCDEGVVHAAHNLFVHTRVAPNREAIALFGRLVPKPDLLVWVTAPTTQSRDVILRRGHSRVSHTAGAAEAFVEHAHATFNALAASEGLEDRILRFDNTVRPELNGAGIRSRALALAELLKQHLQTSAAPASTGAVPDFLMPSVQTP
jgi:PST family polysaccharide transporter